MPDPTLRITTTTPADDPSLAKIYFNGFSSALATGDVRIDLMEDGKPIAVLHASFTVAKTLAVKLSGLIEALEQMTQQTIMTTDDTLASMQSGGVPPLEEAQ